MTSAGADSPRASAAPGRRGRRALLVAGILLVALNLRTAVTSVGAVLGEVRAALDMSGLVAGLVTTLPVVCFAVLGAPAAWLAARLGAARVLGIAMLITAMGLAARAVAGSAGVFLLASALALSGAAIGNVLLPLLVKENFPRHVGAMSALYTTALAVGTAAAAGLTVPAQRALGGDWRIGLGLWAGLALVAVLPWLGLVGRTGSGARTRRAAPSVLRSRLAWALAVFFGCQSLNAYVVFGWLAQVYRDAGLPGQTANLLLAVVTAMAIPVSLLVPPLAARFPDQRVLVVVTTACYAAGYVGLILAPVGGAVVWAVLLGLGGGAFPLALTMIGLSAREPAVVGALSGFVQSTGYLLAAAGPVTFGVLHAATGGWAVPVSLLLGVLVIQLVAGLFSGRARVVDDELPAALAS